MFNEKDLLVRLQNGETMDDIAKELTAALNAANKEYEIQKEKQKREEEEMWRKKEAEVQKKIDLESIMDDFIDWAQIYGECPVIVKYLKRMSAEEMLEALPVVEKAVKVREDMENWLASFKESAEKVATRPAIKATPAMKAIDKKADDILETFMKSMGW